MGLLASAEGRTPLFILGEIALICVTSTAKRLVGESRESVSCRQYPGTLIFESPSLQCLQRTYTRPVASSAQIPSYSPSGSSPFHSCTLAACPLVSPGSGKEYSVPLLFNTITLSFTMARSS